MARPKPKRLNPKEQKVLEKAAAKKKNTGLTDQQRKIVEKDTAIREIAAVENLLEKVPASVFLESGETLYLAKKLIDQYEIPIPKTGSQTFDMKKFFQWFYDFLSGERFLPEEDDDGYLLSVNPRKVYLKEKAIRERIARKKDEKELVPVEHVNEIMYRFTTVIRLACERLADRYGPEFLEDINEAIDDSREHIADLFNYGETIESDDEESGGQKAR